MLTDLSVSDVAVIKKLEMPAADGMTVLSGETGAGKSIIIDSINMVLGDRTKTALVRFGEKKAVVQAVFDVRENIREEISEYGIDCDDGQLVITREIYAAGKSLCRINGMIVSQTQLREITAMLVNIHGQHDNQALLDPSKHICFVDSFGKTETELEAYRAGYTRLNALKAELAGIETDETERLRRIDMLTYQINEITAAELVPGEEQQLTERRTLIVNAEKIKESTLGAYEALYGGERSAYDTVSEAVSLLDGISGCSADIDGICENIRNALYTLEDSARDIEHIGENVDFDEYELDGIEQRLDLISKLKRKYGGDVQSVISFAEDAQRELDTLADAEERSSELEHEIEMCEGELARLGAVLSEKRRSAAAVMQKRVREAFSDLDMGKADFKVDIKDAGSFRSNGTDTAEFMISTNAGEPLKSLSEVASGGELSRVMLALKSVLADADGVETMIFDEIDTGVSGAAAQKIAKKLSYLAGTKQVICISHLPQLAAMADNHYLVSKSEHDGKTETSIELLDKDGRIKEIARLTDGEYTNASLTHAKEMLERAAEYKNKIRKTRT